MGSQTNSTSNRPFSLWCSAGKGPEGQSINASDVYSFGRFEEEEPSKVAAMLNCMKGKQQTKPPPANIFRCGPEMMGQGSDVFDVSASKDFFNQFEEADFSAPRSARIEADDAQSNTSKTSNDSQIEVASLEVENQEQCAGPNTHIGNDATSEEEAFFAQQQAAFNKNNPKQAEKQAENPSAAGRKASTATELQSNFTVEDHHGDMTKQHIHLTLAQQQAAIRFIEISATKKERLKEIKAKRLAFKKKKLAAKQAREKAAAAKAAGGKPAAATGAKAGASGASTSANGKAGATTTGSVTVPKSTVAEKKPAEPRPSAPAKPAEKKPSPPAKEEKKDSKKEDKLVQPPEEKKPEASAPKQQPKEPEEVKKDPKTNTEVPAKDATSAQPKEDLSKQSAAAEKSDTASKKADPPAADKREEAKTEKPKTTQTSRTETEKHLPGNKLRRQKLKAQENVFYHNTFKQGDSMVYNMYKLQHKLQAEMFGHSAPSKGKINLVSNQQYSFGQPSLRSSLSSHLSKGMLSPRSWKWGQNLQSETSMVAPSEDGKPIPNPDEKPSEESKAPATDPVVASSKEEEKKEESGSPTEAPESNKPSQEAKKDGKEGPVQEDDKKAEQKEESKVKPTEEKKNEPEPGTQENEKSKPTEDSKQPVPSKQAEKAENGEQASSKVAEVQKAEPVATEKVMEEAGAAKQSTTSHLKEEVQLTHQERQGSAAEKASPSSGNGPVQDDKAEEVMMHALDDLDYAYDDMDRNFTAPEQELNSGFESFDEIYNEEFLSVIDIKKK